MNGNEGHSQFGLAKKTKRDSLGEDNDQNLFESLKDLD
jgi:hypothetical protein